MRATLQKKAGTLPDAARNGAGRAQREAAVSISAELGTMPIAATSRARRHADAAICFIGARISSLMITAFLELHARGKSFIGHTSIRAIITHDYDIKRCKTRRPCEL